MKRNILKILFLLLPVLSNAQPENLNTAVDSLNFFVNKYNITKFFHYRYQDQSFSCVEIASNYAKKANAFVDSSKLILDSMAHVKGEKKLIRLNKLAHQLYDTALISYKIADSLNNRAKIYIDSSEVEKKNAENYLAQLEVINNRLNAMDSLLKYSALTGDSLLKYLATNTQSLITPEQTQILNKLSQPSTYVVQIGAGDNMDIKYFSKVKNLVIYIGNDGLKRYTVGEFITQEDAVSLKQKMIDLGFKDCFIRRIDPETMKLYKK